MRGRGRRATRERLGGHDRRAPSITDTHPTSVRAVGRAGRPIGMATIGRAAERTLAAFGVDAPGPDAPTASAARHRVRGTTVTMAAVIGCWSPAIALVVLVAGWNLPGLLEHRDRARRLRALDDALLFVVELMSVCTHAGANLIETIDAVAPIVGAPLGPALASVASSHRAGVPLDDALATFVDEVGARAMPLGAILRAAHLDGEPLAPALDRLGGHLRNDRRRRIEGEARRLAVRMLVPLVCCLLPAFALECVAPVMIDAARRVGH